MSEPAMHLPDSPQLAPSSAKKPDKSVLAKGCLIGCGVLVVLAIFGGIGGFFVFRSFMEKMGDAMGKQLVEEFAVMKDTGQVPEEHMALYQEVVDLTVRPETTFTAAMVASTVVRTNLEDSQVTPEERQEAEDMRDFLSENPEAGMWAIDSYLKEHPKLKERVEQAQRSFNPTTLLGPQ
ncbi:MAG: hypothetical protein KJ060_00370 [Candidatus Hydrogenedentes bacterium]|nr:hypothetical protein [Candidatus Hydrogenedentota bacterium]